MAPTFNSDKRMSLGTNHVRMAESLVARLNPLALGRALSAVRSASCHQDCFRSALLFCERARTVSQG